MKIELDCLIVKNGEDHEYDDLNKMTIELLDSDYFEIYVDGKIVCRVCHQELEKAVYAFRGY